MKGTGTIVELGSNFVDMSLDYQRAGTYQTPAGETLSYDGQPYAAVSDRSRPAAGIGGFQALPVFAVSTDLGLQRRGIPIRFGIGFVAPNAFPERNFDRGYQFEANVDEPPPPQRYDSVKQNGAAVGGSLAVAYQVTSKLDLGARFSVSTMELKGEAYGWGLSNYENWIARDAFTKIDVKDSFVPQFGAGVLYRPTSNIEVGAAYASGATINAKGSSSVVLGSDLGAGPTMPGTVEPNNTNPTCAAGGTGQSDLKTCMTFKLPQTASIGARYILRDARGGERADIEFDAKWENWAGASKTTVLVDGIAMPLDTVIAPSTVDNGANDTFSFRLGGSYALPVGANKLTVRGGAAFDTAATPESWSRLGFDGAARVTLATGVAYDIGRYRIEFGGGIVLQPDRNVPDDCNPEVVDKGCLGNGEETPVAERERPDPVQPTVGGIDPIEAPYNAGVYKSGYVMLHFAVSARF